MAEQAIKSKTARDNLLIGVLGNRYSGKSYTWNTLFDKKVKTGTEIRRLYFDNSEYVEVFLVSGSPEERKRYVGDIINGNKPRIVLCSMQYTETVIKTIDYFIQNNYFLFIHWLNPGKNDLQRQVDNLEIKEYILQQNSLIGIRNGKGSAVTRTEEIKDFIYGWAKSRNLLYYCKGTRNCY